MTTDSADAGERLVTAAEVARLAGVTRAAVSNWRRRHPDFPEPASGGRNALFALSDITDWLDRQRKNSDISDEVLVWQSLRGTYRDDMAAGVADVAEMFLGEGPGLLDHATCQHLTAMANLSPPTEVVSALVDRVINAGGSLTTRRLAKVVAQAAGPVSGNVLDPACGLGSLLLGLDLGAGSTLYGQEINASAVRLARARARLAGVDLVTATGDSLRADRWPDLRADLVVCDPPVGVADWGRDGLILDGRWEFGVPTRAESELAWLQHCYAHLAPGGRAVMIMSPSVAYRKAGRRIRAEIVRRGIIEQVIALPAGMVASHALPVHLWVFSRPSGSPAAPASVRMSDLTDADPDGPLEPSAEQVAEVPLIDLLVEAVDLTPAVYVAGARDLAAAYAATRESMRLLLRQIGEALPELLQGSGSIEGGMLRIADLARAGLVEIDEQSVVSATDQLETDYLRGFLRSGANVARSTSASGNFRMDVRAARVPQMSIADQRSYAAAFRALDEAESTLREAARLGQEAIVRAREGLTNGVLRPGPPR